MCFGVSLDGFGAGPDQSLENPLGVGFFQMMEWMMHTRVWKRIQGQEGGETGVDNQMAERSFENMGAWILGRNMFGPVRGPWPDDSWKGWWGDNPPYHVPTFVLTHHPRATLKMEGGTEFRFVTDGIESAMKQAKAAAAGKNVRIGGGVSTVRQYLKAGLVDEMHFCLRPVYLGQGEQLWSDLDLPALGFQVSEVVQGERTTHVMVKRKAG